MSAAPGESGHDAVLRAESRWAMLAATVIVFLLAMVVFTALHWASMPPSRVETIDPRTLHLRGEFIESNLGTGLDAQGHVTVHLLAQQYSFRPSCIVVPAGTAVTFRATSSDVVHGMQIMGTNVNTMLVPGYVSTFITTLDGEGERLMPCHEFCGPGHAAMWARVKVISAQQFLQALQNRRRIDCA